MSDEERTGRLNVIDKQAAFVAVALGVLWLAAWTAVSLLAGEWQWAAVAALMLLLTAALIGGIAALFKLSEWLFRDSR